MATTILTIIPSKEAESAQTTQYTSNQVKTTIDKFTATNTSAANATLGVNLVTVGDTEGNSNLTLKPRTIAPGETYLCPELVGHSLEPGGFISTLAGTANAITIRSSGRAIS